VAKPQSKRRPDHDKGAAGAAGLHPVRGQGVGEGPLALDRLIHERLRLGILSALAVNESLSFNDLKKLMQTTDGNLAATVAGPITTVGPNAAFATTNVGDVLTLDAGSVNQENVTVTAVNRNNGTVTFTALKPHAINFTITSAQTSTLQQAYANLVSKVGGDTAAAITGNSSQTTLASNVNQVRQSTDGINIDEETQNLVKFQNAYGAAAHVMAVLSAMLSDAINLGSGTTF